MAALMGLEGPGHSHSLMVALRRVALWRTASLSYRVATARCLLGKDPLPSSLPLSSTERNVDPLPANPPPARDPHRDRL